MAQSCPPPGYNELDKVNRKVNDMERMIRELEESNKRMMKTMSEPFTQLCLIGKKGFFPVNQSLTQEEDPPLT